MARGNKQVNEIGAGALCPYCNSILDARSSYCSECGVSLQTTARPITVHPGQVLPAPAPTYGQLPHYPSPSMGYPNQQMQPQMPMYAQPAPHPWTPMPPQVAYSAPSPMTMLSGSPMVIGSQPGVPSVVVVNAGQPAPPATGPTVVMINGDRDSAMAIFGGAMALFVGGLAVTGLCLLMLVLAIATH